MIDHYTPAALFTNLERKCGIRKKLDANLDDFAQTVFSSGHLNSVKVSSNVANMGYSNCFWSQSKYNCFMLDIQYLNLLVLSHFKFFCFKYELFTSECTPLQFHAILGWLCVHCFCKPSLHVICLDCRFHSWSLIHNLPCPICVPYKVFGYLLLKARDSRCTIVDRCLISDWFVSLHILKTYL